MNISRVNILNRSAHFLTPATKVRKIVQTEMGEGLESFLWRRGIEDDLDQAQKGVVFDDELSASAMGIICVQVQGSKVQGSIGSPTLNS